MNQFTAARLRVDLNAAGVLEGVHGQKGAGNIFAHGQQAVVAQHQVIGRAQVGLQAGFFVIAQGDTFVVVVGQRAQHKGGLLAERQHAALLRADGHARAGVGVQHAARVFTPLVNAAVNDETRRVDGVGRVAELVAVLVDLDQAGGRDFVKHHAVGVDQKMVFGAGNAGADVGEHQVAPAIRCHQPIAGGQVAAQLPFFGANCFLKRRS